MNAVSRVSSLSLALPVSVVPFSSSLSFLLFLPFPPFPALSRSPSLWSRPSLSLLSCSALDSRNPFISRSRFRGSVPFFFPPSDLYARLPSSSSSPANLAPVSPPFTRALFRLLLRSVPTACVFTAKSIDRNVFRSGRNERGCNRREWGGI